jgi:hypothetical protein
MMVSDQSKKFHLRKSLSSKVARYPSDGCHSSTCFLHFRSVRFLLGLYLSACCKKNTVLTSPDGSVGGLLDAALTSNGGTVFATTLLLFSITSVRRDCKVFLESIISPEGNIAFSGFGLTMANEFTCFVMSLVRSWIDWIVFLESTTSSVSNAFRTCCHNV